MSPRRACSVDANQGEIAAAFRRLGWDVIDTHAVGQLIPGFPDLIVISDQEDIPIEVKMPGARLTLAERWFAASHPYWRPVVVRSIDDVLDLSGMSGNAEEV